MWLSNKSIWKKFYIPCAKFTVLQGFCPFIDLSFFCNFPIMLPFLNVSRWHSTTTPVFQPAILTLCCRYSTKRGDNVAFTQAFVHWPCYEGVSDGSSGLFISADKFLSGKWRFQKCFMERKKCEFFSVLASVLHNFAVSGQLFSKVKHTFAIWKLPNKESLFFVNCKMFR